MPRDSDSIGLIIDEVSRHMADTGVTEDDERLIREVAQGIARLMGSLPGYRVSQGAGCGDAVAMKAAPLDRPAGGYYEAGWDAYSERWESSTLRGGMRYLGDEWGSPELTDEIITQYVKPYLQPDAIVLEIGCGGGKFSERLAPLCKVLICADVSGRMLQRTQDRLRGVKNVRFEKLNGLDFHQFEAGSLDFVFSFDCFVHLEIEDVYCYLQEIRRVLRPRGGGLVHVANLNSEQGWQRFVAEVSMNRGGRKHLGWLRFLTWEIVEKFLNWLDLEILAYRREPWRDILVVFSKREAAASCST